ncbi:MAG: hypothetical protein PT977_13330 [Acidobacteriota bacterium]|nr:hypothetical protein [Acidobacteriota bacterium]
MTNRTILSAILAAGLVIPAAAGLAGTPCDLLPDTNKKEISPEKIEGTLCNACVGLPVPGARDRFGNGLDYNDGAKHWECEMMVGNRGNGQCKKQTICRPGGTRFDDNGVFRCRYPAVVITVAGLPPNPRDNCERALPFTITEVHDDRDQSFPSLFPGTHYLWIRGPGAANATSGEMTGGVGVTLGVAARRLGPSSVCLPPDCQDVKLVIPPSAAGPGLGTSQTLKLYTPHRYHSETMVFSVKLPPTPAPMSLANQGTGRVMIGAPGSGPTPTPTRTPTPQPARNQSYSAGLGCPGGQTSSTNVGQSGGPSQVFEIRSAQVQATAGAQWLNSRTLAGAQICSWEGAFQFTIKALDGQGDVTVSWNAQHANSYSNPLALSTSQTVTLTRGRWQIVPDGSFPVDFTYTVSFRD